MAAQELKEPTFGQAKSYLHIRATDCDGGRGRRDKDKKRIQVRFWNRARKRGEDEDKQELHADRLLLIRVCDGEDNRAMTVVTGIQFNQSQHAVSHNTDALLTESGCPITLTPPFTCQTNLQHKLMCAVDNRCLWNGSIMARVCWERSGSELKFKGPMSRLYKKRPEWLSCSFD